MGNTIRLRDKTGPGTKEIIAKEIIAIKGKKKPKMNPFTKKERI
jgi:hypothetical protein